MESGSNIQTLQARSVRKHSQHAQQLLLEPKSDWQYTRRMLECFAGIFQNPVLLSLTIHTDGIVPKGTLQKLRLNLLLRYYCVLRSMSHHSVAAAMTGSRTPKKGAPTNNLLVVTGISILVNKT